MTSEALLVKTRVLLGVGLPQLRAEEILERFTGVPVDAEVCQRCDSLLQYIAVIAALTGNDELRAWVDESQPFPIAGVIPARVPLNIPPTPPSATAWARLMGGEWYIPRVNVGPAATGAP